MIAVVVDSNSQLPPELAERYRIAVVPLTVIVDGVEHLEGVDLTATQFYDSWSDGHVPEVSTSQPSPGAFVATYEALIDDGATEILSVHVAESMSGTLNAARVASRSVSVPVRLVDTGTASFGISCCAWAAAEAIAGGADIESAATIAEQCAAGLGTTFVVGVPSLMQRSGRTDGADVEAAARDGIPVVAMAAGTFEVLGTASTVEAAVAMMEAYALAWVPSSPAGLRIAVGTSDATSEPLSAALTDALQANQAIGKIVHYTIGPSVGAHTGPGTAGLFVF